MRFPIEFALACAAAIAFAVAGRFFVQRPEQVYRAVSFGGEPDRAGIRLMRGVGWFYICAGTIAAVLFLAVAMIALIHGQR